SQALGIDPTSDAARDTLAELYLQRLSEAESAGYQETVLHFRTLLEHFEGGRYAPRLVAPARVSVVSQPEGARVTIFRYKERGRVLRAEDRMELGPAPVTVDLAPGSYLAVLDHD